MKEQIAPHAIRKLILEQSHRARVGHIGSALSIADIIAVLFGEALHVPEIHDPQRDRFVLSKGHAALALYAALYLKGVLNREQIESHCRDGAILGVHAEHQVPGIEFSTGSLGHGLAYGAGIALAARMSGASYRAFVLLSDAECNEGSVWESIMFAAHHKLSNLIAIVDNNGQQAFGKTKDILDLSPIGDKWRVFGWDVREVDGHSLPEIRRAFKEIDTKSGKPHAIIAKTVSGKGVSFMEGKVEWHYLPLSDELYAAAIKEIESAK